MTRSTLRHSASPVLLGAIALFTVACSGSGSGCSALAPIPSGRYEGPKTDNAVTVRVSPHGINYLNQNWQSLLGAFAPGSEFRMGVPCSIQDPPGITSLVVGDQGRQQADGKACADENCGLMDGKCCPTAGTPGCNASIVDTPKEVVIKVTGFSLTPVPGDRVRATATITVNTGDIFIATQGGTNWCFGGQMRCSIDFNTGRASPASNTVEAEVRFTIDQKWDKLLAFEVASIEGTKICGSGAPAKPRCLDPADLDVSGRNFCGSSYCGTFDWAPIKTFILQQISPMLQTEIRKALDTQSCMACGTGLPACPSAGGTQSVCQSGTCIDPTNSKCVPRFLGIEGRLAPGMLLSGFGVPLSSQLDLSVAAGSSVSVDQGINLGTRAGIQAVETAACVPTIPAPQLQPMTAPNFDAEAPMGSYHVGVGVASSYLDLAMHHAHQSGTMCIGMSSANFGILNTGLFKTFLPSLGRLATRDGKDAPMMIVLKPARVPAIAIGEGTFDPVTKKPVKPLITLTMTDLTIDFYAMIDDRFVRLFSLTADVSIPLSLIFENCSSVTPALGDLNQLITNVRTANSEMLAEDPKVLADLIPAVIGLAEPALAGALQPFELPAMGGFKLKVNATKGLTKIAGTERYEHLGLYAELLAGNAQCSTVAPKAMAQLVDTQIPSGDEMRLQGRPLQWPTATVRVDALGATGTAEYAWRVDGGVWSTFLAPSSGGEFRISHPRFLLQGRHVIELRTRLAENPHGVSEPVSVEFVVDYEAPEVTLIADRQNGVLNVTARDFVTPADKLLYAYRVGSEPAGEFGPARVVDLAAVEAQGGLEVLVRDETGLVGTAQWKVPTIALRPDEDGSNGAGSTTGEGTAQDGGGCSGAGGGLALGGLVALVGMLRNRRRARDERHIS